jgi:site-specific DNA-methyltransferase (adenine-specific)
MKDTWQTPEYVFNWLDNIFDFDIDVCASESNTKCNNYFDEEYSALDKNWSISYLDCISYNKKAPTCWMNPPYSRGNLPLFMKKAYEEGLNGCTVVCLAPLDMTAWVRDWVIGKAEVWIPDERINFINPDTNLPGKSPSKGNMIVIYGPTANIGHIEFIHIPL